MSLYTPGPDGGFLHADAADLAWKLQNGDGLTFSGDPRLELRVGILEEKATGRIARRYEVWRTMEDGREERLGHWRLDEFHSILPDLVIMRAGAEGKVKSVDARLAEADRAMEKQKSQEFRDAYGPMIEHALALRRDLGEGRNTHYQVGGTRDEPKGEPAAE